MEGNLFFTSQIHRFETGIMLQNKSYSIKWSVKLLLEGLVSQSALGFSGKAFSTLLSPRLKYLSPLVDPSGLAEGFKMCTEVTGFETVFSFAVVSDPL